MKRMIYFFAAVLSVIIFLLFGLYIAISVQEGLPDSPVFSDCIIVLGNKVNNYGPSHSLEGRLERAYELYTQGYANKFIVCGGQGVDEPATEASVMRDWLIERHVPPENIYLDEVSRNTRQNISEAKKIMQANGMRSAIICTSDFHSFRAMRTAKDAGIIASSAKARTGWKGKSISRFRECFSWIKYFVGL